MAVLACVVAAYAASHVVMGYAARYAEIDLGAYLWWQEEYLQLFTPSNYENRGTDRLLIYGPSESREAFMPKRLTELLPTLKAYQHSQSIGTIDDGLVVLNYIEQAYGSAAMPRSILLGITTRFISNIRGEPSPLFRAINRYSPDFKLDESTKPPTLVHKSFLESYFARLRFINRQQQRYRSSIRAIVRHYLIMLKPSLEENEWLARQLTPAKYYHLRRLPIEATKEWLSRPGSFWEAVHAWKPAEDRGQIIRNLSAYKAIAKRHHTDLYVVNMPELSWNRKLYQPGAYEAYLAAVTDALGHAPFLDLRTYLSDDDFFDSCHATKAGSIKVSTRVAAFIIEQQQRQKALQP